MDCIKQETYQFLFCNFHVKMSESRVEKMRRLANDVAERRERVRQQAAAATQERGRRLEAEYEARLFNRVKRRAKTEELNAFLRQAQKEREKLLLQYEEILQEWRNSPRMPLSTDPEVIRQFIVDDLTSRGERIPTCYAKPNVSSRFIGLVVRMNREEIFERERRAARHLQQQQQQQ